MSKNAERLGALLELLKKNSKADKRQAKMCGKITEEQ